MADTSTGGTGTATGGQLDIAPVVGATDASTSKRKQGERDRDALLTQQQNKEVMGLFALLALIFQEVRDDQETAPQSTDTPEVAAERTKKREEKISTLAQALGGTVDRAELTQVYSEVQSGKTGVFSTAERVSLQVIENYGKPGTTRLDTAALDKAASIKVGSVGQIPVGDRQIAVAATIPKAAAATGISPDFMRGLWGFESSFGKKLVSPTGCEGDWQFSQGTWNNIMKMDGAKIASLVSDPAKAAEIRQLHATKGALDKFQYDPEVSTYAAAFLNQRNAKALGVDAKSKDSWGVMYAAYNVGTKNAKELKSLEDSGTQGSVMSRLGSAAAHNPYFFTGGATASTALDRYQSVIEARLGDYNKQLAHLDRPAASDTLLAANTPAVRDQFARGGVEQPASPGNATPAFANTIRTGGTDEAARVAAATVPSAAPAVTTTTRPA